MIQIKQYDLQEIFKILQDVPSSSSSYISLALGLLIRDWLENKEEFVRKEEMFSPISLNSLSCSWWAPIIANDDWNPEEEDVWLVVMLAPFNGSWIENMNGGIRFLCGRSVFKVFII